MSKYLTVREASAHLKLSKSFLDKLRLTGGGPAYLKLGARRVVYDRAELDAWASKGRRLSTSAQQVGA
jgi:predicted DNA-binding transcriptional regulator AlpA